MKVLYIHQYFRTPDEGGAIRSYYLTRELVKKGFEVEVISAHNENQVEVKNIEGVRVHYLPVYYHNSLSFSERIRSYLKFAFLAIVRSYSIKKPDLCYVMTTPLTTGLVALCIKWTRRVPYIFEVGDLWPLVPVEMGIIRNKVLKTLLFRFEKLCYAGARGIVALSPAIAEYIESKVPGKPIETITNIADCAYFVPEKKSDETRQKFGIKSELVISYAGTLGMANQMEYLVEAAMAVANLPVKFLIIGEGAQKEKITGMVGEYGLRNVTFLPQCDRKGIREVLNVSDAIYISFVNIPSINTGSPNKLFDGLASGKLIIVNFEGWIKNLIYTNDAGFSYSPENTVSFNEKLSLFLDNKEILKSFQKNARQLAENSFSLDRLSEKQEGFINKVTGKAI